MLWDYCQHGKLEEIKKLFSFADFKLKIEATDIAGNTCLLHSCKHKHTEIVKYVIEKLKANIYHENNAKLNLFKMAVVENNIDIIKYLIVEQKWEIKEDLMSWLNGGNQYNIKYESIITMINNIELYQSLEKEIDNKINTKKLKKI